MRFMLTSLHIIVSTILIGMVLLQKGKGADIGAAFGGASNTVFGPRGAQSFMAKLTTGSEEWNRYLSYLQGQIETTRGRKADALSKMADPAVWDTQVLTKLKSDILQADAMIAAWEWAMELPKALADGGAEATEFLNKLERENDAEKPASQG